MRKIILNLADILQLNKTTVIASCGCFRNIFLKISYIFAKEITKKLFCNLFYYE